MSCSFVASKAGCVFVLFGATGDLARRQILPALFALHRDDLLGADCNIFAVAPPDFDACSYPEWLDTYVKPCGAPLMDSVDAWSAFVGRVNCVALDPTQVSGCRDLVDALSSNSGKRVLCMAVDKSLAVPICRAMVASRLDEGADLILESSVERDSMSSVVAADEIGGIFEERQIYRMGDYLDRGAIQNLLAFRFGDTSSEALWRKEWIESVQITMAEDRGVEERAHLPDRPGALLNTACDRLLQLLAIVAMEPPATLDPEAIRDERARLLGALKPIERGSARPSVVCGQYRAGRVGGQRVRGYLDEAGVSADSLTETFVALRAEIDNDRWAGVPFHLRIGKRLPRDRAEIVVNFRRLPRTVRDLRVGHGRRRWVIQLLPGDAIQSRAILPPIARGFTPERVELCCALDHFPHGDATVTFRRLLLDAMGGKLSLFVRRDEREIVSRWIAPAFDALAAGRIAPIPYVAGTWGPSAARVLPLRDGACWPEDDVQHEPGVLDRKTHRKRDEGCRVGRLSR